jgi:hypothetical protein
VAKRSVSLLVFLTYLLDDILMGHFVIHSGKVVIGEQWPYLLDDEPSLMLN